MFSATFPTASPPVVKQTDTQTCATLLNLICQLYSAARKHGDLIVAQASYQKQN